MNYLKLQKSNLKTLHSQLKLGNKSAWKMFWTVLFMSPYKFFSILEWKKHIEGRGSNANN